MYTKFICAHNKTQNTIRFWSIKIQGRMRLIFKDQDLSPLHVFFSLRKKPFTPEKMTLNWGKSIVGKVIIFQGQFFLQSTPSWWVIFHNDILLKKKNVPTQ